MLRSNRFKRRMNMMSTATNEYDETKKRLSQFAQRQPFYYVWFTIG